MTMIKTWQKDNPKFGSWIMGLAAKIAKNM